MNNIKIAVVGLGTVGSNVVKSIESLNKSNKVNQKIQFEIIGISAKSKSKKRIIDINKYKWFDDPIDLFNYKFDVLIELIGTEKDISYNLIKKALSQNINVITANKALLAKYGNELFNIAKNNKVKLLFEAAVAGGIPIINLLKNSIFLNKINHISGILNGTTNFILSQMEKNNFSFDESLKLASDKGYAEQDHVRPEPGSLRPSLRCPWQGLPGRGQHPVPDPGRARNRAPGGRGALAPPRCCLRNGTSPGAPPGVRSGGCRHRTEDGRHRQGSLPRG